MRISEKKINPSLKKQIQEMFVQTLVDIRGIDDAKKFLEDFFTDSEYETFAKRLAIGYWLKKGRSYVNIKDNLKVSSATIASVQEMIAKDGFKEAIKRTEADEWANVWSEKIKKFVKI
jgi:uncharacterized protein YerC